MALLKGEAAFLEGLASIYEDDMPQRKSGDIIRWSMDNMPGSAKAKTETQPRAEFHPVPVWELPEIKTDDPIVKAGREYATKIIDDIFEQG